ncbi:baseplate J/gp47 family protein [Paracandidimonas lactea]|uniref:baseplate J/gp47 family protein n=1 Tax=Paracandidimonas lactea TaxID=2895524 RepID=UPI001F1CDD6F|nr:baseplate J/gp47 family protein [Paracandidimonas lactea]
MADYGITPDGFVRPRLPEIRAEIIDTMRANLRAKGLPDDIETRPDSVMGVVIDTFADREAALWEMGEGVYYAMYPGSAVGAALDRSVSFSGVKRLQAERSQAYVVAYGIAGTVIGAGSQIRHRSTQSIWETTAPVTISAAAAADVRIVPTIQSSSTYTITVDATAYSYVSDATATGGEILAGLTAALATSGLQVANDGAALRLVSTAKVGVNITLTANLTFSELGSAVLAQTVDVIPEVAEPGDLNTIVTLTTGWTRVTNLQEGSVGRLQETDAQLRARYRLGVFRFGAGTLPSIGPNILNDVPGITDIRVFDNKTDIVDAAGRKPHSVHVIVDGGIDDDIAVALYKYKGGGIDTNGAVTRTLATAEGQQIIQFDRPTPVYVWVKAVVTLLPPEEQAFPSDGFDQIRAAILATGQAHVIGQDVRLQRFFCEIYKTPGIANVELTFASTGNPAYTPVSGDYSAANITIADIAKALFDASRIEVT